MGKGDQRTRKGKITAGSYGKSRPKKKKVADKPAEEGSAKKKSK